jgi:hypothetical protein
LTQILYESNKIQTNKLRKDYPVGSDMYVESHIDKVFLFMYISYSYTVLNDVGSLAGDPIYIVHCNHLI